MNTEQKNEIKQLLIAFIEKHGSQNKAAKSINVSAATISQIINDNWESISPEMWRTIGSKVGFINNEWIYVETKNFQTIKAILQYSQNESNVIAFVSEAGSGKSAACKSYVSSTKNAFRICCDDFWNKKFFLESLLQELGRDNSGLNVPEMMSEVVKTLKAMDHPLIILDEADKLTDSVLYFFITLYNKLEDHCGIVICATDHLEKRIKRGLKLNKKGYKEIFSRVARKFIPIGSVLQSDVIQICLANGISDSKQHREIFIDSEGDLRRVKQKIKAIKKQRSLN